MGSRHWPPAAHSASFGTAITPRRAIVVGGCGGIEIRGSCGTVGVSGGGRGGSGGGGCGAGDHSGTRAWRDEASQAARHLSPQRLPPQRLPPQRRPAGFTALQPSYSWRHAATARRRVLNVGRARGGWSTGERSRGGWARGRWARELSGATVFAAPISPISTISTISTRPGWTLTREFWAQGRVRCHRAAVTGAAVARSIGNAAAPRASHLRPRYEASLAPRGSAAKVRRIRSIPQKWEAAGWDCEASRVRGGARGSRPCVWI